MISVDEIAMIGVRISLPTKLLTQLTENSKNLTKGKYINCENFASSESFNTIKIINLQWKPFAILRQGLNFSFPFTKNFSIRAVHFHVAAPLSRSNSKQFNIICQHTKDEKASRSFTSFSQCKKLHVLIERVRVRLENWIFSIFYLFMKPPRLEMFFMRKLRCCTHRMMSMYNNPSSHLLIQ